MAQVTNITDIDCPFDSVLHYMSVYILAYLSLALSAIVTYWYVACVLLTFLDFMLT